MAEPIKQQMPTELPRTRLPGRKMPENIAAAFAAEQAKLKANWSTPKPAGDVPYGKPTINVDRLLSWVTLVGTPRDAGDLIPFQITVNAKILQLGVRPNKSAIASLPKVDSPPSFNADEFLTWVKYADASDLPALQKVSAAMRLRIRQAAWLTRKR
jgi:hypothetical protein